MFTPPARDDDDGNNDNVGRCCFVSSAIGVDKLRLRALKTPLCVFARVLQQHIPRQGKKKGKTHSGEYKIFSKIVPVKCYAEPKKVITACSAFIPPHVKNNFPAHCLPTTWNKTAGAYFTCSPLKWCFVMSQRALMPLLGLSSQLAFAPPIPPTTLGGSN